MEAACGSLSLAFYFKATRSMPPKPPVIARLVLDRDPDEIQIWNTRSHPGETRGLESADRTRGLALVDGIGLLAGSKSGPRDQVELEGLVLKVSFQ